MATDRTVLVRLKANVSDFNRGLAEAAVAVKGLRNEINTTNERTAWLVQGFLALAPALVPLGAAAVPVLSGITTQLTIGAAAAGVLVLGLNNITEGVKALDKFQLDPTVANFEKLQQVMTKLGPDGADFVLFLDSISPKLRELQMAAKAGMLPGFEEGITDLLTLLPQFESIISQIAQGLGQLGAEAGAGLAGDRFRDFFAFMQTEARPILIQMGHTVGNFADGLAAMIVAFAPVSKEFSSGFESMSKSFADWAHNLNGSDDFQGFLDYIDSAAPKALDFLGSLIGMFTQIAEAAAPVGDVLLPAFSGLFDVIGAIADTGLGSVFIGLAAGIALLGRAMALSSISTSGFGKVMIAGSKAVGIQISSVRVLTADLRLLSGAYITAQQRAQMTGAQMIASAEAQALASARLRSSLLGIGKASLLVGGFALATSGATRDLGLTNTAMLGLTGSLAGPWGAAIGAGVGLLMEFKSASGQAADEMDDLTRALKDNAGNLVAQQKLLDDRRANLDSRNRDAATVTGVGDFIGDAYSPQSLMDNLASSFGKDTSIDKGIQQTNELSQAQQDLVQALFSVGTQLDKTWGDAGTPMPSLEELTALALRAKPAMDALGISLEDLQNADGRQLSEYGNAIRDWLEAADSAPEKAGRVADALSDLEGNVVDTTTAVSTLKSAMDELFGANLDQAAATDAWYASLKSLRDQIKDTNGDIVSQTEKGRANREEIRSSVEALQARALADAQATGDGAKFASTLLQGRDAIIATATAAGASKKQVQAYVEQLGLTPKALATIITTPGVLSAKAQVHALGVLYDLTPKQVNTLMSALGTADSYAQVERLQRKYDLTPKELQTLLKAKDQASAVVARVNALKLYDKTMTITTKMITLKQNRMAAENPALDNARGGMYAGGVRYYDQGDVINGHQAEIAAPTPARRVWAEPETQGESYIPHANDSRRPRAKNILEQTAGIMGGRVQWFADGGILGPIDITSRSGGLGGSGAAAAAELNRFSASVKDSNKALSEETKARRDDLIARRDSIRTSVTEGLRSDIFATDTTDPWASAGQTPTQALWADIRDARAMRAAIKRLKNKGVGGALLQDIEEHGLETAQAQAAMSRSDLRNEQRAYNIRQRVTAGTGAFGADAVVGPKLDAIKAELAQVKHAVEKSAKETGEEVTKGLDKTAQIAHRDRPRHG